MRQLLLAGVFAIGFSANGHAQAVPAAEPAVATSEADDKWGLQRLSDAITRVDTVFIRLVAVEAPDSPVVPRLFMSCRNNKTEVFVGWGEPIANGAANLRVTYRIGNNPPVDQRWPASTDDKSTIAPDWAGNLLKAMLDSDEFAIRATPEVGPPRTAVFNTEGLRDALAPVAEACGWDYPGAPSASLTADIPLTTRPPLPGTESGYAPTIPWKYQASGPTAFVVTPSGDSSLYIQCVRGEFLNMSLFNPTGWTANGSADLVIDGQVFETNMDYGSDEVHFSSATRNFGLDGATIKALKAGSTLVLKGTGTARMADQDRTFSLKGATAAITSVERSCGM